MRTLQDMVRDIQRLGDGIKNMDGKKIVIHPDRNGMIDRQCPSCNMLFMVADGDLNNLNEIFCPCCGHEDQAQAFFTKHHNKAIQQAFDKALENKMKYNTPLPSSFELESTIGLEGETKCTKCDATFSTAQPAQFCPCCGSHFVPAKYVP
jgi:rRNA maturation endonuclease Nob1